MTEVLQQFARGRKFPKIMIKTMDISFQRNTTVYHFWLLPSAIVVCCVNRWHFHEVLLNFSYHFATEG